MVTVARLGIRDSCCPRAFHLLFPAVSALFTGQRQGDVLSMAPPRDGLIEVKAEKTKSTVWILVLSDYQIWIDRAAEFRGEQKVKPLNPADERMHVGAKLRSYSGTSGFKSDWQRLMDKKPFAPFKENRLVFHGLRKNAVINLLEVGCTEDQVGSICNMSPAMVRHYGKEVPSKKLARDAMALLEQRSKEVIPVAFANKNRT